MLATAQLYPALKLKERLVVAAEREIAEVGIGGFRKKEVVKDAGSPNISLLNYHFKSLEKLVVSAIFYRAKAEARYYSIVLNEFARIEEAGGALGLEHFLAGQVAFYYYTISHTLPAPFYCSAQEALVDAEADIYDLEQALGFDWNRPKREYAMRFYMIATQLLGEDQARLRSNIGRNLLLSGCAEIEQWLRDQPDLDMAETRVNLKISRLNALNSLCAFFLRENYKGVSGAVVNLMEIADAKAGDPSWVLV